MSTHHTTTSWTGGMAFTSEVNGHHIALDLSPEDGGQNTGARPKPLLLTALAGCTGVDVVSILNKMHVTFSDLRIEADADLSEEHPKVYTAIRLTYKIKVKDEDRDKVIKAVTLSKEKYCGVSAMLEKVCPIHWDIQYL
jgi:putative redox protein